MTTLFSQRTAGRRTQPAARSPQPAARSPQPAAYSLLPPNPLHQRAKALGHQLGRARSAGPHDVEPDRAHADAERATHVGALVVADVECIVRLDAQASNGGQERL